MKVIQRLTPIPGAVLVACLVMGTPTLAQQPSDDQETPSQESDSTTDQDNVSDDRDSSSSESSDSAQRDQGEQRSRDSQEQRRDRQEDQRREETSQQRDPEDQFERRQDRDDRQLDRQERRRDDGFDRREGRFDRREGRVERREGRVERREDRFEQERDRFRGDRFDRRDARFGQEQDRFDRQEFDRQENVQGDRFAGGTNLGVTFRADPRGRLIISDLASTGLLVDSGLLRGDVIALVDGRPVQNQREFIRIVTDYDGGRIPVVVLRNGRRETLYVSVYDSRQPRDYRHPDDYRSYDNDRAWLGVYLDTRYSDRAVVEAVQVGSAADRAGLRAGDLIIAINDVQIQDPSHLSRMVRRMEPGEQIRMEVSRRVTRDVAARLGERPESGGRFRYDDGLAGGRSDSDFEQRGFRGDVRIETDDDANNFNDNRDFNDNGGIFDGRIRERIRERRNR